MIAAVAGGIVGTQIGVAWASTVTLQRLLGVVLVIAGMKFLLESFPTVNAQLRLGELKTPRLEGQE